MKVLVSYMSQTGNTRKVADAIFQEITHEKELKEFSEIDNVDSYDFIFVGFPIHGFAPAEAAKVFLDKFCRNKKIALFITHAAVEEAENLREWIEKCREAAVHTDLQGVFHCQGELAKEIADFMTKSGDPGLVAYAKERPSTIGQPDEERLERARAFARDMIS